MPADRPDAVDEVTPDAPRSPRSRRVADIWGPLAAVCVTAVVLLVVLTQCVPHVPDVVGLSQEQASARLTGAGYQVGSVSRVSMNGPAGKVAQQSPAASAIFATGRPVDLVVALGSSTVDVPDLLGSDTPAAEVQLSARRLSMDVAGQYSSQIPPGAVMSQNPRPGTVVRTDSQVVLVVSLGIEPEGASGTGSSAGAGTFFTRPLDTAAATGVEASSANCTASYPGAAVWASGGDIYIRLSPGAGAKQITSGSGWDSAAVLSPDAKHVVFLRASSSGAKPGRVGRVCLTGFDVALLNLPVSSSASGSTISYDTPVFAPSPTGTAPGSDWLVTPQHAGGEMRLLVTNVPADSTWVSVNLGIQSAGSLKLSRSSAEGCVKVTKVGANGPGATQDFNAYTGMYTE